MGNINEEIFKQTLIIKEKECIGELKIIQNLINLYENSKTKKNLFAYRDIREKLKLTQKEFAAKCGVSITTMSHFENGINIHQENYDKILNIYEVSRELQY